MRSKMVRGNSQSETLIYEKQQRTEATKHHDLFAAQYVSNYPPGDSAAFCSCSLFSTFIAVLIKWLGQVWVPVDATECTGFDVRTYFGFHTLFMGRKGVRLPLNMPDMVLVTDGVPVHWLFTAKSGPLAGNILKKKVSDCVPEKIMKSWHVSIFFPRLLFLLAFLRKHIDRRVSIPPGGWMCGWGPTHVHVISYKRKQSAHCNTHNMLAYIDRSKREYSHLRNIHAHARRHVQCATVTTLNGMSLLCTTARYVFFCLSCSLLFLDVFLKQEFSTYVCARSVCAHPISLALNQSNSRCMLSKAGDTPRNTQGRPRILAQKAFNTLIEVMEQERQIGNKVLQVFCSPFPITLSLFLTKNLLSCRGPVAGWYVSLSVCLLGDFIGRKRRWRRRRLLTCGIRRVVVLMLPFPTDYSPSIPPRCLHPSNSFTHYRSIMHYTEQRFRKRAKPSCRMPFSSATPMYIGNRKGDLSCRLPILPLLFACHCV